MRRRTGLADGDGLRAGDQQARLSDDEQQHAEQEAGEQVAVTLETAAADHDDKPGDDHADGEGALREVTAAARPTSARRLLVTE